MEFTKLLVYITLFLIPFSCTRENQDLENVYDVLYIRKNGADMPMHIAGNAASNNFLIILHGGPGGNGLTYRLKGFTQSIEKECAVIYFDQRGQGMSQGHQTGEIISVAEMITDIDAIMDVVRFKYGEDAEFFMMGHSWGGTLGSAYLGIPGNQDKIKGWIAVDGAHDMDLIFRSAIRLFQSYGSDQINIGNSKDFWEETLKSISEFDSLDYSIDDFIKINGLAYKAETALTTDGVLDNDIGDLSDLWLILKNTTVATNPLTSYLTGLATNLNLTNEDQIFSSDYSSIYEGVQIPTLLLWGRYDLVVPISLGYQAYEKLPGLDKELYIFEKSGHSPMINESTLFGEVVAEFIRKYK